MIKTNNEKEILDYFNGEFREFNHYYTKFNSYFEYDETDERRKHCMILARHEEFTLIKLEWQDDDPLYQIEKTITKGEHFKDILENGDGHKMFSNDGIYAEYLFDQ